MTYSLGNVSFALALQFFLHTRLSSILSQDMTIYILLQIYQRAMDPEAKKKKKKIRDLSFSNKFPGFWLYLNDESL